MPVSVPTDVADAIEAALKPGHTFVAAVWDPWPALAGNRGTAGLIGVSLDLEPDIGLLRRHVFGPPPGNVDEFTHYLELGSDKTTFGGVSGTSDPANTPLGSAPFGYWTFDASTASGDPGSGKVRLDASDQLAATVIRVSSTDADGFDQSFLIDSIDAELTFPQPGGNGKYVNLVAGDHFEKVLGFRFSGWIGHPGYREITLAYLGQVVVPSSTPFADGETVCLQFPGF